MAFTKVPKPTLPPYTPINPIGKEQYDQASLAYDDANTFYDGVNQALYTNVAKPLHGPGALVQSNKGYTGSSPLTIAYNSLVTKGNLLVVCVSSNDSSDAITVSDNQNNVWTKAMNTTFNNSPWCSASIFYAIANGNNTPTVTLNGADVGGSIYEYSGLTGTINNKNSTVINNNTGTPTATPLVTTLNTVIVAMAAQETNGGTFSACGGGFTLRNSNGSHVDGTADYQNAIPGSYSSVFNFNVNEGWIILQVAFEVAPVYTKIPKPV